MRREKQKLEHCWELKIVANLAGESGFVRLLARPDEVVDGSGGIVALFFLEFTHPGRHRRYHIGSSFTR